MTAVFKVCKRSSGDSSKDVRERGLSQATETISKLSKNSMFVRRIVSSHSQLLCSVSLTSATVNSCFLRIQTPCIFPLVSCLYFLTFFTQVLYIFSLPKFRGYG